MRSRHGGGSRGPRPRSAPINSVDGEIDTDVDGENNVEDEIDSSGAFDSVEIEHSGGKSNSTSELLQTAQIEYLVHQSTMGVHFLFSKRDVARVMMIPTDEREFFTLKNMERVQRLLTSFLEKPTLLAKERYLNSLGAMEKDLMIRAYFHLVENTILSNSDLKH